jgi:hypothetical protein
MLTAIRLGNIKRFQRAGAVARYGDRCIVRRERTVHVRLLRYAFGGHAAEGSPAAEAQNRYTPSS